MSDAVAWLREAARRQWVPGVDPAYDEDREASLRYSEAADEIERLRLNLEGAKSYVRDATRDVERLRAGWVPHRVNQLEAEVERLRAEAEAAVRVVQEACRVVVAAAGNDERQINSDSLGDIVNVLYSRIGSLRVALIDYEDQGRRE